MVRACLSFPLALVLIVYVGSSIALECYVCGPGSGGPSCADDQPGSKSECASVQEYCMAQFNEGGKPTVKMCLAEADVQTYQHTNPEKKGDNCYSEKKEAKAMSCFCKAEHCNEKSMATDYYNGGGGSGKGSSSMIKPSVWTNLMWIGLVLASAFYYSRMRAG